MVNLEKAFVKLASKLRKDFSEKGSEYTKVRILDEYVIIKYIAHYTKPELLHHKIMKDHPEQSVYRTFIEGLSMVIKDYFNNGLETIYPPLQVNEVRTCYLNEELEVQIVLLQMNHNVESLLKNGQIA